MLDLKRIEEALTIRPLHHGTFERCAQDLLTEFYPGLVPIPGGSDSGRDADIVEKDATVPPRLLATTSRTLDGVRKNMRAGLKSMKEHGVTIDRIVLANPASLNCKHSGSPLQVGIRAERAEIHHSARAAW